MRLTCGALIGLLLHAGAVFSAEATSPTRPFAAPEMASTPSPGGAAGIGQVTFALLLVLVAVFVVAVLVKRFRSMTGAGGGRGIEVVAQTALGQRERVVIVRVGDARLVLGVAPGQVNLLHTLPPGSDPVLAPPPAATGDRPGFAELLKRSLGR